MSFDNKTYDDMMRHVQLHADELEDNKSQTRLGEFNGM